MLSAAGVLKLGGLRRPTIAQTSSTKELLREEFKVVKARLEGSTTLQLNVIPFMKAMVKARILYTNETDAKIMRENNVSSYHWRLLHNLELHGHLRRAALAGQLTCKHLAACSVVTGQPDPQNTKWAPVAAIDAETLQAVQKALEEAEPHWAHTILADGPIIPPSSFESHVGIFGQAEEEEAQDPGPDVQLPVRHTSRLGTTVDMDKIVTRDHHLRAVLTHAWDSIRGCGADKIQPYGVFAFKLKGHKSCLQVIEPEWASLGKHLQTCTASYWASSAQNVISLYEKIEKDKCLSPSGDNFANTRVIFTSPSARVSLAWARETYSMAELRKLGLQLVKKDGQGTCHHGDAVWALMVVCANLWSEAPRMALNGCTGATNMHERTEAGVAMLQPLYIIGVCMSDQLSSLQNIGGHWPEELEVQNRLTLEDDQALMRKHWARLAYNFNPAHPLGPYHLNKLQVENWE